MYRHFKSQSRHKQHKLATLAFGACAFMAACQPTVDAAEAPTVIASPTLDNAKVAGPLQTAVFAGGCFWGVQGVFEHVAGVRKVVSGYDGGSKENARYTLVGSGETGHAESVRISYDPARVSYGELLQVFFSVAHDPTQFNRQGPDSGTQYRSAIFYSDSRQKEIAETYIAQLNKVQAFAHPVVTQVNADRGFYPAEDYHQDFLIHNPSYPYIMYNDLPKIEHLKKLFPRIYLDKPVTVDGG
ncbi:MAG TPA: peptide-methionine (S)-S-oxide reductase MsrA [Burkholderiaceae bacterium]|jgi:peptide-methionine (S)-S-oxide reductase